jgi:hypothetical protein
MGEMMSQKLPTEFVKNSLFLVMDPWEKQPYPGAAMYPWIDSHNTMMMYKIVYYSKRIVHRCTSVRRDRSDVFYGWDNLTEKESLVDYMTQHKLDSIVYAGFHHGLCIVDGDLGCRRMSEIYKCYLKHDLVCLLPHVNWGVADSGTARYAEFI